MQLLDLFKVFCSLGIVVRASQDHFSVNFDVVLVQASRALARVRARSIDASDLQIKVVSAILVSGASTLIDVDTSSSDHFEAVFAAALVRTRQVHANLILAEARSVQLAFVDIIAVESVAFKAVGTVARVRADRIDTNGVLVTLVVERLTFVQILAAAVFELLAFVAIADVRARTVDAHRVVAALVVADLALVQVAAGDTVAIEALDAAAGEAAVGVSALRTFRGAVVRSFSAFVDIGAVDAVAAVPLATGAVIASDVVLALRAVVTTSDSIRAFVNILAAHRLAELEASATDAFVAADRVETDFILSSADVLRETLIYVFTLFAGETVQAIASERTFRISANSVRRADGFGSHALVYIRAVSSRA